MYEWFKAWGRAESTIIEQKFTTTTTTTCTTSVSDGKDGEEGDPLLAEAAALFQREERGEEAVLDSGPGEGAENTSNVQ